MDLSDPDPEAQSLTALANAFHSDKGTAHPEPHAYTLLYDLLLQPRRQTLRRMLEIGLCAGGPEVGGDANRAITAAPSVDMWLRFFPNAMVHGFDISDFSAIHHPRFVFARGDSGVEADLQRAAGGETFDLVVDDGSHASFHQQLAFKVLFPHLAPGGLYIIEDLHWQSPFYLDLPRTITTAELVDHWFRNGRFPSLQAPELEGLEALGADVEFAFVMTQPFVGPANIPKMAVLRKRAA